MGAQCFFTEAFGKDPESAFSSAVEQANYDYGQDGYTGTIAEKNEFEVINVPAGKDAYEFANQLVDNGDPRIDNKWGPAGCLDLTDTSRGYEHKQKNKKGTRMYLFFGWASE
jgi:hypothetical protein